VPDQADIELRAHAADPAEFRHIEVTGLNSENLVGKQALVEDPHNRSVLRGDIVDEGRRARGRGAGHVLDNDPRFCGYMARQKFGDRASIEVEAAARRKADDDAKHFPPVELLRGVGCTRGARCKDQYKSGSCPGNPAKIGANMLNSLARLMHVFSSSLRCRTGDHCCSIIPSRQILENLVCIMNVMQNKLHGDNAPKSRETAPPWRR
jgi:hypothetical protein